MLILSLILSGCCVIVGVVITAMLLPTPGWHWWPAIVGDWGPWSDEDTATRVQIAATVVGSLALTTVLVTLLAVLAQVHVVAPPKRLRFRIQGRRSDRKHVGWQIFVINQKSFVTHFRVEILVHPSGAAPERWEFNGDRWLLEGSALFPSQQRRGPYIPVLQGDAKWDVRWWLDDSAPMSHLFTHRAELTGTGAMDLRENVSRGRRTDR